MSSFFLRRILGLFVVLWAMTAVLFIIIRSIPGDPVAGMMGFGTPRYVIESTREQLGLDRPLIEQYFGYVSDLVRGEFGLSIETRGPVGRELANRFTATAELVIVSMVFSVLVGVTLGIIAAAQWGRWGDSVIRLVSLLGAAVPLFWIALIFQLVFFRQLRILPVDGRLDFSIIPPTRVTGFMTLDSLLAGDLEAFVDAARHLILPSLALALNSVGLMVRQTRASMLQIIGQDFIRTARAKGLTEAKIMRRHAVRNAAIPIVTEIGLQFGTILSATFLVEVVFSWPGLGLYAVRSILNLDYPVIMGVAVLFTFVYVVVNFLVDLSYPLLDPRITQ